MPSPIGHALAGIAVAWSADIVLGDGGGTEAPPSLLRPRVALCAGLAMLPDADLLVPGAHRTATHSITAACLTFIVVAAVTAQVTRLHGSRFGARPRWRTATLCALAYASHLLLDWLGADFYPPRGIQLLWPWSREWFISNLDVFRQTARQHFLTRPIVQQNLLAVAQEIAILAPILLLLWLVRVKTTAGLAPELSRGDHPAK